MSDRQLVRGRLGNRAGSRSRVLQRMFGIQACSVERGHTVPSKQPCNAAHRGRSLLLFSARSPEHQLVALLQQRLDHADLGGHLVQRKEVGLAWRVSTGGEGVVPENLRQRSSMAASS